MKSKIEFSLKKSDKKLTFIIIDQVGFVKSHSIYDVIRTEYKGFDIRCQRILYPAIYFTDNLFKKEIRICLRGRDGSKDKKPYTINFKSNEERDKIYDIILGFFKNIYKQHQK